VILIDETQNPPIATQLDIPLPNVPISEDRLRLDHPRRADHVAAAKDLSSRSSVVANFLKD
jgi:hypothetical protein